MDSLPGNWHLVEEWDNNLVFENSDYSFSVEITFTKQCSKPYSISFSQLKGIFILIGFENGAYRSHTSIKSEALEKAIEMMMFINNKSNITVDE